MTEASRCIYTLIFPLTEPATNHCPGNELGYLHIVERPNIHIISLQLVIHYYTCEHWLIATEPYDRIPTTSLTEGFQPGPARSQLLPSLRALADCSLNLWTDRLTILSVGTCVYIISLCLHVLSGNPSGPQPMLSASAVFLFTWLEHPVKKSLSKVSMQHMKPYNCALTVLQLLS